MSNLLTNLYDGPHTHIYVKCV